MRDKEGRYIGDASKNACGLGYLAEYIYDGRNILLENPRETDVMGFPLRVFATKRGAESAIRRYHKDYLRGKNQGN